MFSPFEIASVQISIDDVALSSNVEHVQGPLHVCPWQPDLYSTGLHRITVIAKVNCDQEEGMGFKWTEYIFIHRISQILF